MMKNNLYLRRLVVFTNQGKIAYDEKFHNGINIICGDNSSGKSTITHFIFLLWEVNLMTSYLKLENVK